MIILEGPDNAGKSTLAEYIKETNGLTVVHSGGPSKDDNEIVSRMTQYMKMADSATVMDRIPCISDPIYCRIIRGVSSPLSDSRWMRGLLLHKPIIIYCRPSEHILLNLEHHLVKEHETKDHVQLVNERARILIEAYDNVMKSVPHILWDWTAANSYCYSYIACIVELDKERCNDRIGE